MDKHEADGAMLMSVSIGFAGGFAGATWAAGETADVPASAPSRFLPVPSLPRRGEGALSSLSSP